MTAHPPGAGVSLRRFFHFAAVGAVGTVAHYLVLVGLVEVGGVDPVIASVAGFLTGALVNYILNRQLVFRSDRAHHQALPRFLMVAGTGLAWNALLMGFLVDRAGWPYLLAQVLTTGILVVWHYLANALWTFRQPTDAATSQRRS